MSTSSAFCCICIETATNLVSVLQIDERDTKYVKKLKVCEPNQDWESEQLSICKLCIGRLDLAYIFIEDCRKSETLRNQKLLQLRDKNNVGEFINLIECDLKEESTCKEKSKNILECDTCKKQFKQKRFLKLHITRIHSIKKKIIEVNEKVEVSEDKENSELELIKTGSDSDCDDEFFENGGFDDNNIPSDEEVIRQPKLRKKYAKRKDPLNCEYCGKLFNRRQHWSAHIRANHTFEKPYQCSLCEASFINSHSLLVHKRKHNNEKPYICSSCGKSFVCSGDLYHHSKIHLNKREYQCNVCEKRFNTTSILRTHKIVKHMDPKEWKYACSICDRRFPINSGLAIHMKRHAGVKDFSCHICDKKFFNKSEVTKHVLSHSSERRFKCPNCEEKEYKNREGLRKHLKLAHDIGNWKPPKQDKKFLCPMCPKLFNFNNKLQRHILTHTGEKPFKCEHCDKKFIDNYYRKVHLRKDHKIVECDENKY
ncbi:zinc finger protein 708-like [Cylas formicarius]|uniref:zinc finger protein 708-like n=1 Tax=Cylas formicarius TaxID=197179 RepID=UPI0029586E35|nr:zinc finger protein 708-like [Cylas formicarius]